MRPLTRVRLERVLGSARLRLSVDGCTFTLDVDDVVALGQEVVRVLASVERERARRTDA